MKYWLLKSEPNAYSLEDLKRDKVEHWDGVRNYQARNFMRDDMKKGDVCLFYHSNCKIPHVAGVCTVVKEAYPDFTAWDIENECHFDSRSTPENPLWFMVDVAFKEEFKHKVALPDMRKNKKLQDMLILRKGNRLSITPISVDEFHEICAMSRKETINSRKIDTFYI